MLSKEKMLTVLGAVGNYLADYVEQNSPVTSSFRKEIVRFDFGDSENLGVMTIAYEDPEQLRLTLGVFRKGTDRLYSNFLPKAGVEETVRRLRDPASHEEWAGLVIHLSESVDDFWD